MSKKNYLQKLHKMFQKNYLLTKHYRNKVFIIFVLCLNNMIALNMSSK